MLLMVARSAGLVSIIISLILSFAGDGSDVSRVVRLLWLVAGVLALWIVARSDYVERYMRRVIEWALRRWTDLDVRDYAGLLKLSGEYTVEELHISEGDWLAGKELRACRLNDEGVTVLDIYRNDGSYVGAPKADTEIYPEDTLILYGRGKTIRNLDERPADHVGDAAHEEAVSEQKRHEAEEQLQERHYKREREAGEGRS